MEGESRINREEAKKTKKRLPLPKRVMLAALAAFSLTGCGDIPFTNDQIHNICSYYSYYINNNENGGYNDGSKTGVVVYLKNGTPGRTFNHDDWPAPGLPQDGRTYIFTRNLQTGETKNLNIGVEYYTALPDVSPDGLRIAYINYDANDKTESINVVNVDGQDSKQIYKLKIGQIAINNLEWSPDGSLIAFDQEYPEDSNMPIEIGFTTPDGAVQQTVKSNNRGSILSLDWSPKSDEIVFSGDPPFKIGARGRSEVYTLGVRLHYDSNHKGDLVLGPTHNLSGGINNLIKLTDDHVAVFLGPNGKIIGIDREYEGWWESQDEWNTHHLIAMTSEGSRETDITSVC